MRMPHIVPLSEQSIAILKQIKDITGNNELIFPGDHNPYKPMCENTVNKALRVMGYDTKKDICGHGFRAMACSALMESGLWAKDAVERQMSHQERNTVRMAYIHKAEHGSPQSDDAVVVGLSGSMPRILCTALYNW